MRSPKKPPAREIWIANASPIIVLAKAGHLALLDAGPAEVLIPRQVVSEIAAGPPGDPARAALESGWGRIVTCSRVPESILEWGLGPGEAAVVALAMEREGACALLDDAQARRCAQAHGVPVLGTLGAIVRAKKAGSIESAAKIIEDLRQSGLYLDDHVVTAALVAAGEESPMP
jgi:predicted nucleic acid-binding protein